MSRFRIGVLEKLNQLLSITEAIYKEIKKMSTTLTQEDAQIGLIETGLAKLGTDFTTALADLKAAQPGIDVTPEFNRLVAIAATITTQDAAVTAADPGPVAPDAPASN